MLIFRRKILPCLKKVLVFQGEKQGIEAGLTVVKRAPYNHLTVADKTQESLKQYFKKVSGSLTALSGDKRKSTSEDVYQPKRSKGTDSIRSSGYTQAPICHEPYSSLNIS